MSTKIRAEVSTKSKWYLDKHRYYELKHFCLQYPLWVRQRNEISFLQSCRSVRTGAHDILRRTEIDAEKLEEVNRKIEMLEIAARETDCVIGIYILRGVIGEKSYDAMNAAERIPCCREVYYELYRKFFYILSGLRG